jgi:hypothetical protein
MLVVVVGKLALLLVKVLVEQAAELAETQLELMQ